jgi:hypothetical protein
VKNIQNGIPAAACLAIALLLTQATSIAQSVAPPTFTPVAGSYGLAQTVIISTVTPGAAIYYTTDGTTPTTSSILYSAPVLVATSETLEAIAVTTGTSATVPVITFTDTQSGPATGGEGGNGEYLTIFGYNFGATQGTSTVTVNGTPAAQYLFWGSAGVGTLQKIGVQIAAGTTTGPIVVTVGGSSSANNPTFTIRTGNIWYIGPGTDTSSPGNVCSKILATGIDGVTANSYTNPWGLTNYASTTETNYTYTTMRTPYTYYHCIADGDTLVFLNGVSYPYFDGYQWHSSLSITIAGTSSSFITLMARPGATATLGGEGWAMDGIRNTSVDGYTVYSGLTLVGSGVNGSGLAAGPSDRIVGNTINCPSCSASTGALIDTGSYTVAYGNILTAIATDTSVEPNGSNKQYHDVYFGGNGFEFAWNRIYNTAAYNGFQIYHDGDSGFYNFSIHDNDIADVNGSGINLGSLDPASGYVQVYNNVIHHTGLNWSSDGGDGDPHNCIAVKGSGSATGAGTTEIYNNTMYDCSSILTVHPEDKGSSCAILIANKQLNVTTNLVNNIVYQPAYTSTGSTNVYICGGGGTLSGSNNIWYSDSTPGNTAYATTVGKIENPLYESAADGSYANYYLQPGSPAIGAGVAVGPVEAIGTSYPTLNWDFDDSVRPSPPSIGAFEYPE